MAPKLSWVETLIHIRYVRVLCVRTWWWLCWLFQVLSSILSEMTVSAQHHNNTDVVQVTSVLTLSNVKSSDAGVYQCVASNVVATVYSERATITVSGKCHVQCAIQTSPTDYKLCTTVYKCLHRLAPKYLADLCIPVAEVAGWRQLHSASRGLLDFPPFNMSNYGRRAFS